MKTYVENEWTVFAGRVYKYIRRWEATNRGSVETGESGRPLISQHPSMVGCIGHMDSKWQICYANAFMFVCEAVHTCTFIEMCTYWMWTNMTHMNRFITSSGIDFYTQGHMHIPSHTSRCIGIHAYIHA